MMDAGPAGGDGRRRGKKNRTRQGRRKRSKNRGNRSMMPQMDRMPPESILPDDRSVLAGRAVNRSQDRRVIVTEGGPPDAFALFCAYYLGITPGDGYQKPQPDDVARRFGITPKELKGLLGEHGLDEDSIHESSFDLEGAQLDIRLAPEGISRTEVARELFEAYLEARDTDG